MSNSWFRLYNEFATDPKVQSMDECMQRRLIMLFCLQSNGDLENLSTDEIAFALHVTNETLHETLALFQEKGFCDENGQLINWQKRQYVTDSSTERVRRHREKKKQKQPPDHDETKVKRYRNVSVTPPDTETDTEKKETTDVVSKKSVSLDELSVDHIQAWLSKKRVQGKYTHIDAEHVLDVFKNYCHSKGKRYKDYVAAYKNAFDWERFQSKPGTNTATASNKDQRAKAAVMRAAERLGFADSPG